MLRRALGVITGLACCLFSLLAAGSEAAPGVDLHIFWSQGCPHCEKALAFLDRLEKRYPDLRVHRYELSQNPAHLQAFVRETQRHRIERPGVPMILIGGRAYVGYRDDASTGEILEAAVRQCLQTPCIDSFVLAPSQSDAAVALADAAREPAVSRDSIRLPLFGAVDLRGLSLPLLTVTLAAADGFNPCAMWVLVFLIGLLLGVTSKLRRWLLGSAFIAASALVYYLIMAAWLNTLLVLGAVIWIRLGIALVAVVAGVWLLRDFFRKALAACEVTAAPARRLVLEKLRVLAVSSSMPLALAGIVLLAFAVNVVELLCSAGIPAVFTQSLALRQLPSWQYHAYLGLYVLVFMLDDLIIFLGAMLALEVTGLGQSYARWTRLIGAVVLMAIGALMVFKPEWLM